MRRSTVFALVVASLALEARAAKPPEEAADAKVAQANIEMKAGRFEAARDALDAALKRVPTHDEALFLRCSLDMSLAGELDYGFAKRELVMESFRRAGASCGKALETNPGSARRRQTQLLLLRAQFETRAWEEAATHLETLIAEFPDDGRLVGGYAAVLDRCGRSDESRAALDRAAARGPDFDRAARFEFVWDRFDPKAASRLRPMIAELESSEPDPRRRAMFEVLDGGLSNPGGKTLLAFLEVVESGALNRYELGRLWKAIAGPPPDDGRAPWITRADMEAPGLELPALVGKVEPSYPASLRARRVSGRVILVARLNADGSVGPVWPIQASHPDFALAAERAVRGWTYTSAKRDGQPIPFPWTVRVDFRTR